MEYLSYFRELTREVRRNKTSKKSCLKIESMDFLIKKNFPTPGQRLVIKCPAMDGTVRVVNGSSTPGLLLALRPPPTPFSPPPHSFH